MSDTNQLTAKMTTSKGEINLHLFADQTPLTVANFVNLVQRGYYNDLSFHRVIDDFMVQGGCPYSTGTGGPGYNFEDEFDKELQHSKPGILSMANAGPGTNGSQFFITHIPTTWLDGKHTIFGEVMDDSDQDVVNSIVQGDKIESVTIEGDTTSLLEDNKDRIEEWNKEIDSSFPNL